MRGEFGGEINFKKPPKTLKKPNHHLMPVQDDDQNLPMKIKCNFPLANEMEMIEGHLLLHPKSWELSSELPLSAPAAEKCSARGSHSGRCFQKLSRIVK